MTLISDKTSLLFYSKSGNGKSTQARYIAEYLWKKHKKKLRFIAADRGSLWSPVQDLVDQGIVIPLEFPTSSEFNPFAVMRKLRRGEWPQDGVVNAPTRVETKNGAGLQVQYKMNTIWNPWCSKDSDEIGGYFIDSLTSYALSLMSDAKQKNLRSGNDANSTPRTEDGEQSGTNTQSHYGDAHTEVLDAMNAFQMLPIHIAAFTALEGMGTDDSGGSKRPALGPETVGKAINAVIPSRVQSCLHLTSEGEGAKKVVKAWYESHDSEIAAFKWPCKIGLLPTELAQFWKQFPNGFIPLSLDKGIGAFLEFRDSMRKKEV